MSNESEGPHTTTGANGAEPDDVVEVELPAAGAYLSVLRTATAGLAARLDFTIDEIEDLRIAVDEACAMLLEGVEPASRLRCRFELGADSLLIEVAARTRDGAPPQRDTFAWAVLSALAGGVEASADGDGHVRIRLRKVRGDGS